MLPLCTASWLLSSSLMATTIDRSQDIDQKDINALREWINTKRQVTVKELGGALSLSAEVRTEMQSSSETRNGVRQRGHGAPIFPGNTRELPSNEFDVEVNIMLDYRTEGTWTAIKLEFDNDAGIFNGSLNKLKVEKAYWGVRTIDNDHLIFDIELGRRRMSTIVDSKLEFNNFFDGAWFKYDQTFDSLGDFYVHTGAFIIDTNHNQFGYLGEIGLMNIAGTGFYSKYSLTDWNTKHFSSGDLRRRRFAFTVSQLLIGYRFYPPSLQKAILCYLAGLYNHSAKRRHITHNHKANGGGYIGLTIGELKKKGDWAFDINYQLLQAQCVPDFDVQGIGLGNASNNGFYTTNVRFDEKTLIKNTRTTAGGNVNYRGFQATLDWLLTNQLDFQQSWQQSITLDKDIGPFRRFKQYEIEFIYSF